ncbi:hypothetical protein [Marinobacter sp. 2_MG-2023]|uniref:hypothetical protein n=1 Tax=Marinobacter sp. 2_MG-2023 TaxID=3062679 RepID=UPI0026E31073|nr:hypothetical protein [Marinobacter sp. 2_MG-2023]MDO6442078.1 hypothetical protein [Marinobacter sp. 2_MG-2023]
MEPLEFTAEVIKALAWPSAVVIAVVILRTEVANLLGRITKIKHKDSEIDLAQEVQAAANSADKVLGNSAKVGLDSEQGRASRLAEDSPRGAILDAWLSVEEAMTGYEKRHGIEYATSHAPPHQRIQSIQWSDLDKSSLGQGVLQMLQKLRRIRNEAVHSSDAEITSETAREYASLAARVRAKLEEA